ncbi:MAG: hypothetical protein U5K75_00270 [Ahrensia sp.]|nr:hypothetical protein [Ahrensia sp.]
MSTIKEFSEIERLRMAAQLTRKAVYTAARAGSTMKHGGVFRSSIARPMCAHCKGFTTLWKVWRRKKTQIRMEASIMGDQINCQAYVLFSATRSARGQMWRLFTRNLG